MPDDYASVRPDLLLPRRITTTSFNAADSFRIEITARWVEERLAYDIAQVSISSEAESITSSVLRSIALRDQFRQTVEMSVLFADMNPLEMPSPEAIAGMPDDERLEWASRAYVIARAYQEPPLVAVAEALGVSQSTATRLIARARSKGLFDG